MDLSKKSKGARRKLHNDEFHNLYCYDDFYKKDMMAVHVTCVGETEQYKIFVKKATWDT